MTVASGRLHFCVCPPRCFSQIMQKPRETQRHEIWADSVEMAMVHSPKTAFENIESAHVYIGLLLETIDETRLMIEQEMATPREFTGARHLDALRLVHYKLHSLGEHLTVSRRLLGDL